MRERRSKFRRRWHPIPLSFDVRRLVRRRVDKRGRELEAFETRRAARRERLRRVRRLHSDPAAKSLARLLARCRFRKRCRSMACPECGRLRRLFKSVPILRFLSPYPIDQLRYLTLVNPADALEAGELHSLDPGKLLTRYRRQFERAGIDKSIVFIIAYLDGEWDEGERVYQPHVHAVVYGLAEKQLERLIKKWPKDARVRVRQRPDPIDDLPRVVVYLDKTFWPCVARKNNSYDVYPHGKRRPPQAIEFEILAWMRSHKSTYFRMFFGVKRYRNLLLKK